MNVINVMSFQLMKVRLAACMDSGLSQDLSLTSPPDVIQPEVTYLHTKFLRMHTHFWLWAWTPEANFGSNEEKKKQLSFGPRQDKADLHSSSNFNAGSKKQQRVP